MHFACVLAVGAVLASAGRQREAQTGDPIEVAFRSGIATLEPGRSPRLNRRLAGQQDEAVPALIVLAAQPTGGELEGFSTAGVRLVDFLGGTAYLALLEEPNALDAEIVAKKLRAADWFEPRWKLDALLSGAGSIEDLPPYAKGREGRVRVIVQLYPGRSPEAARNLLNTFGEPTRSFAQVWRLEMELDSVSALASRDGVRMIGVDAPTSREDLNDRSRSIVRSDVVQRVSSYKPGPKYLGRTGKAVRVAVCDGGISRTHEDFFDLGADGAPMATSRIYGPLSSSNDHGTAVASVVGGSGVGSAGWNHRPAFSLRGHAPRVMLGSFPKFHGTVSTSIEALYHSALVSEQSDLTNHSYALDPTNEYGGDSLAVDTVVRGDLEFVDENGATFAIPARPAIWAMGNDGQVANEGVGSGYYSALNQSKNAIVVGATRADRTKTLYHHTSLGPTSDGRIRPDVVAPGSGVVLAKDAVHKYTADSGTSLACAAVSGVVALVMESYADKYEQSTAHLPPSLFRAVLVGTARDLTKTRDSDAWGIENPDTGKQTLYHLGPDFASGFGLVDTEAACAVLPDEHRWRVASVGSALDSHEYCLELPEGVDELRVTLTWDDLPASLLTPSDSPKLVNDLDLTLVHEDDQGNETIHEPWKLKKVPLLGPGGAIGANEVHPAGRGPDRLNNVEVVAVKEPEAGHWRVRVDPHALPFAGTQTYSVVSSHPLASFCVYLVDLDLRSWPLDYWYFGRRGDRLLLPVGALHPLSHLQYLLPGPPALEAGPGEVVLRLDGLPRGATVAVVDSLGEVARARQGELEEGALVVPIPVDASAANLHMFLSPPPGESFDTDEQGRVELGVSLVRAPAATGVREAREAVYPTRSGRDTLAASSRATGESYYRVELGNRVFVPPVVDDAFARLRELVAGTPTAHACVQLFEEPTAAQRNALAAQGIRLIEHLGGPSYIARVHGPSIFTPSGDASASGSPPIRWVGALDLEDRLHPDLLTAAEDEEGPVVVSFHADVPPETQAGELVGLEYEAAGRDRWVVRATHLDLCELAERDAVRWIDPGPVETLERR